MQHSTNKPPDAFSGHILLVEDSPVDYDILKRAFETARMVNTLSHCEDGEDALDYLYQRGAYAEPGKAPRPAVILLDLNLPGTDGREVLAEIKHDPDLRSIPVVVLTTSLDERDIEQCYSEGANSYVQKPVDFDGFLEAVQRMNEFWFELVVLPHQAARP